VDVAFQRLRVEQPLDEEHFLPEVRERLEDLAQFHRFALALGPPFAAVKAVAGKHHRETHGRFARFATWLISPHAKGFHPRECHRDADTAEKGTAGEEVSVHSEDDTSENEG
jgi:hypothetical protein